MIPIQSIVSFFVRVNSFFDILLERVLREDGSTVALIILLNQPSPLCWVQVGSKPNLDLVVYVSTVKMG